MSASVAIYSIGDLLVHVAGVEAGTVSWDDVDLERIRLVIPVIVRGGRWDKRIDVRGARLIENLQRHARVTFKDLTGESLTSSVLIKTDVKAGSNWLDIDFAELLKEALKKMTPKQLTAFVVLGMLCATGAYVYGKYIDSEDARFQGELDAGMERLRLEQIEKANELVRDMARDVVLSGREPAKPMNTYIRSLHKDDEVSIGNGPFWEKKEALSMIEKPKADVTTYTHCDGVYALLGIDLSEELPVLRLEQDGIEAKAYFFARVPKAVREHITQSIDRSIAEGARVSMALHVDCYFTSTKFMYAVVLDIGEPREGVPHYHLAQLPDKVTPSDRKIPGR